MATSLLVLLRDELDFEHHVDYIHYNPVKHNYVNKPSDWKYSSFHRYVEQGTIPINWGASGISFPDGIGMLGNVGECRVTFFAAQKKLTRPT